MRNRLVAACGWLPLSLLLAGCVTEPPPIVIYEDKRDSIWLKFDPEATGAGHSHPVTIASERMAKILEGILVADRSQIIGVIKGDETNWVPAFTPVQIKTLAPLLSEALRKASPKDMATFYLVIMDREHGKLITSGGLFVRNSRLYFILANFRTMPSSKIYETTYEIDTRSEPLLPTARFQFALGFRPKQAWIPNGEVRGKDGYERYLDESKLVIIDLPRLFPQTGAVPSSVIPRPQRFPAGLSAHTDRPDPKPLPILLRQTASPGACDRYTRCTEEQRVPGLKQAWHESHWRQKTSPDTFDRGVGLKQAWYGGSDGRTRCSAPGDNAAAVGPMARAGRCATSGLHGRSSA